MSEPKFEDTEPLFEETEEIDVPTFEDTEEISTIRTPQQNPSQFSELESAGLGLAQGSSLGFFDEIEGAARAAAKILGPEAEIKDYEKLYQQFRDLSRQRFKTAEEENPKSFMAGQVGGNIGTAFVPGLGGASVGKLAALGATEALGSTEAEDLSDLASEAAKGAVIGGTIGKAGDLLSGAKGLVSQAGQKIQDTALLEDLINSFNLAREGKSVLTKTGAKEALEGSRELSESAIKELSEAGKNLAKDQRKILKETKGSVDVYKEGVEPIFQKLKEAKLTGSRAESEVKELQKIVQQIAEKRGMTNLTPEEAYDVATKEFRQRSSEFGEGAVFKEPEIVKALGQGYRNIRDKIYTSSPDLKEINRELKDYNTILERFGLKNISEAPFDERAQQIAREKLQGAITREDAVNLAGDKARNIIEGVEEFVPGFAEKAEKAGQYVDVTKKVQSGGVKNILDKAEIVTGTATGTVASGFDKVSRMLKTPERFGKYSNIMSDAAKRGSTAAAARHYSLYQQDPEYRKMINELPDEEGQPNE